MSNLPPEPFPARITPRPTCELCGNSTVRGTTVAGKGRYTCPSPTCPDSFKVWYIRESAAILDPQEPK